MRQRYQSCSSLIQFEQKFLTVFNKHHKKFIEKQYDVAAQKTYRNAFTASVQSAFTKAMSKAEKFYPVTNAHKMDLDKLEGAVNSVINQTERVDEKANLRITDNFSDLIFSEFRSIIFPNKYVRFICTSLMSAGRMVSGSGASN